MKRLLLAVLFALLPTLALAASPCTGRITDKLNHPKGAEGQVTKPAVGQSYVDPVFGTLITRITNANPADGVNAIIENLYSTVPAWNSDGSMIVAWRRGSGRRYEFYMGDKPYTHLGEIDLPSTDTVYNSYPEDIEHIYWSPDEPNVMYYDSLSSTQGNTRLMKITLNWPSAPTFAVVRDFAPECAAHGKIAYVTVGHVQPTSWSANKTISLKCGYDEVYWEFLYSIRDNTILGSQLASDNPPPFPFPSGTGAYRSANGDILTNAYNVTGHLILGSYLEHSAMAYYAPGGYDTYNLVDFDTLSGPNGSLVSYRMDQASPTGFGIISTSNGWPYPPVKTHVSGGAKDGSGWVAGGNSGSGYGTYGPLDNEIYLANVGTGEVCRIAHARTRDGNPPGGLWGYWGETHPAISNDGYRVLFQSDWENSNSVDLYLVDLRPQTTTILTAALGNGVTTEGYSQALSITGSTAPYTCTKTVGNFPAGVALSGTGNCTISASAPNPTTVESQTFTIQACDSTPVTPVCDSKAFTMVVQQRPTITTASPLTGATVGTVYAATLAATGGVAPRTWSVVGGAMCAGLVLNSDGSISSSPYPITLQTCTFTARVTDSHAQPISKDKEFQLTVALPGACNPNATSVCISLYPTDGAVLALYRQNGLPYDAQCTATLKQNGVTVGSPQTTQNTDTNRKALFTGLDPDTIYTVEALCDGYENTASQVATTPSVVAGARSTPYAFTTPTILPTAAEVKVAWGVSAVSENNSTTACGSSCSPVLSLNPGVYLVQHTWQTAGHAGVATSDVRFTVVQ